MKQLLSVRSSLLAAAFLASVSFATAQTGGAGGKPQEPAKPAAGQQPAAAPQKGIELAVPVKGLTKENAEKVKSNLEAITREFYACAPCKQESAKPGKCAGCKGELAKQTGPVLKEVKVDAEKGSVALATNPGAELRLSAIERAVKASSVSVDDEKMPISGNATLIFKEGASAEEATAIQKALEASKLFQSVKARFDEAGKEVLVAVNGGTREATRNAVAMVLEKAGTKAKPADIAWGGAPVAAAGGTSGM